MGYLKRAFGQLALKDDAYRAIANDQKSPLQFLLAVVIALYFITGVALSMLFLADWLTPMPLNLVDHISLLTGAAVIFGPLLYALAYIALLFVMTLVPHWIGLLFGGSPRKYKDFFVTLYYMVPVFTVGVGMLEIFYFIAMLALPPALIIVLTIFLYLIIFAVAILSLFVMYKTYKIIHKLERGKAIGAVIISFIAYMIFCGIIFLIIMFASIGAAIGSLGDSVPSQGCIGDDSLACVDYGYDRSIEKLEVFIGNNEQSPIFLTNNMQIDGFCKHPSQVQFNGHSEFPIIIEPGQYVSLSMYCGIWDDEIATNIQLYYVNSQSQPVSSTISVYQ